MDRPGARERGLSASPARGHRSSNSRAAQMARTNLTFGDLAGKLHTLCIECTRCERKGRYNVAKLIAQYCQRGNMSNGCLILRAIALCTSGAI